mgnify:CR=1 FL=1
MNEYYTNITQRGKFILYRGISEDGTPFKRREEFYPTMYVPSRVKFKTGTQKKTDYRTLDGVYVEPINPGNIPETRDFIKQYQDIKGFDIYGNNDFVYQFIGDNYKGEIDYDFSNIKVATIDIECESEHGFPKPEEARSLAIPLIPRQSGLLGVIDRSI